MAAIERRTGSTATLPADHTVLASENDDGEWRKRERENQFSYFVVVVYKKSIDNQSSSYSLLISNEKTKFDWSFRLER